jgi:addiction module antitoxin, relB/dinJ family
MLTKEGEIMETTNSLISVQIDTNDKEKANNILKKLGLNMSTFVNMAIKQLIYTDGIPFEVKNPKPSKRLKIALKEADDIISGKTYAKGYNDIDELERDLLSDD